MLNLIRVSPTGPPLHGHQVPNVKEDGVAKMCLLALNTQYGPSGEELPGKCSQICKHGFVICTEDFIYDFPYLIFGGLVDAETEEKKEVSG